MAFTLGLGLSCDGVNPFHSTGIQYSFWPLIFVIYNLPKYVRTKSDALMLYGIVPSRKDKDGKGIEPGLAVYQSLMVDELLELTSVEIYSAYSKVGVWKNENRSIIILLYTTTK